MQQGLAVIDSVATREHDIVANLFPRPPQFPIKAMHRHDRPVECGGQPLQQHDPLVAAPKCAQLMHEDVLQFVVANRPEQAFGQNHRRSPQADRQRRDRAIGCQQQRNATNSLPGRDQAQLIMEAFVVYGMRRPAKL